MKRDYLQSVLNFFGWLLLDTPAVTWGQVVFIALVVLVAEYIVRLLR